MVLELDYRLLLVFMNSNKIYIIAGAGSGLGKDFVKSISNKNSVIGLYNKNKISMKNVVSYKINLENEKEINKFFIKKKKLINKFDELTFVNFATYKKDSLIININKSLIQKTFNINLFSNFYFVSNFIKFFKNKKINIIFISSSLGLKGDVGTSLYSSSKSALKNLMNSIVIEFSSLFNIRCNILVLGFFKSPLWDKLNLEKKQKIIELIPKNKLGKNKDIARAINFIENSSYLNAQSIFLDGGFNKIKV